MSNLTFSPKNMITQGQGSSCVSDAGSPAGTRYNCSCGHKVRSSMQIFSDRRCCFASLNTALMLVRVRHLSRRPAPTCCYAPDSLYMRRARGYAFAVSPVTWLRVCRHPRHVAPRLSSPPSPGYGHVVTPVTWLRVCHHTRHMATGTSSHPCVWCVVANAVGCVCQVHQ
jgi:hypothetical protein